MDILEKNNTGNSDVYEIMHGMCAMENVYETTTGISASVTECMSNEEKLNNC